MKCLRLLPAVLALAACSPADGAHDRARPSAESDAAWPPPPGAAIRVGPGAFLEAPDWILEQDVDRWVPTVSLVEPTETQRSWRRKALTNIVLPMRVGALLFPEESQEVRARVEAARARLVAGEAPPEGGPQVERAEGNFHEVGLDRFGVAHETPVGEWSPVFQTVAGWSTVRLLEAPPLDEWRPNTQVVLEHVTEYYLRAEDDPHALIEQTRRELGLFPIGEWEWILPKLYQYE